METSLKNRIKYIKHCVFHPFEGFYEAKNRGRGSVPAAFTLMGLFCLLQCASVQYTGFIMNTFHVSRMSSITVFISYLTVLLLAGLSNWTVTTLLEGKGKLGDIYMVIGYSLVPVIFCQVIVIFLSNYIIAEETMIVSAISLFGWIWFAFMVIAGLCTIHEYGLARNIVTLLGTVLAACIILFLLVLFVSLLEQMYGFVTTFVKEWIRRAA